MNTTYSPAQRASKFQIPSDFAQTPQPRRTQEKNDEELINSTLIDIAETTSRIEDISAKNKDAHTKCVRLQHELSSITQALDKNIDFLQQVCQSQEEENRKLTEKLSRKAALAEKLQNLLDKCSKCGIDVHKIPGLDIETISEYFIIQPPVDEGSLLDPTVKKIVQSNSYFEDIKTNDEFIERVLQLKKESMRPSPKKDDKLREKNQRILTLRKQLAELQQNNSAVQARMAREMNDLLQQKQKLQKELDMLRQQRRSDSDSSSYSQRSFY